MDRETLSEGQHESLEAVTILFLVLHPEIGDLRAHESCESVTCGGFMEMKELVEKIVHALVDSPEEVHVEEIEGTNVKILEIKVSKQDVGALIGKKGKNITALRTIVAAAGKGKGYRYMVEVLGEYRHRGNRHFQHGRNQNTD